jgi:hypothetical protein
MIKFGYEMKLTQLSFILGLILKGLARASWGKFSLAAALLSTLMNILAGFRRAPASLQFPFGKQEILAKWANVQSLETDPQTKLMLNSTPK